MNSEFVAKIILVFSFIGLWVIIFRKIPILVELPQTIEKESFIVKLRGRIRNIPFFKSFSYEIFLQKILSKIRILTLKTENKTFHWLQKLREKTKKKKEQENDHYWEEIKRSTNEPKKNLPT